MTSPSTSHTTELIEVADRVFAYVQHDGSWWINNTGFVVGTRGVTAVDSCSTHRRTAALLDRIASVTSAPVRTLVNTHHHGDHTIGNSLFADATVVGHENTRAAMLASPLPPAPGTWEPVDWGPVDPSPPTVTFSERLRLWSGDTPIELSWVGRPAHTDNDVLVWLPEQRVLYCGDLLFHGGTPFLLAGSVTGAAAVLREVVAAVPATSVVPGHGAPCTLDLVEVTLGYLDFLLGLAREGLASGISPLDLARDVDLGEYAGWLDPERLVGNLHRAYADLAPSDAPMNRAAALADMVTYHGGRPLACHA